jgi:CheY-like chemotaxis protein/HPt (histidine-containing phosphotransfer) domain-containing protein
MRTAISTFIATPAPARLAPRAVPEPFVAEEPANTGTPTPMSVPVLKGTVLLVEDNPINQKVAQSLVKMLGLDCDTVENGELAIQRMQRGDLDLVLMDCQMPVKDGYTATREWRSIEAERGLTPLPIIAMTANAMAGDRLKCLDAGMDDYLSKPVDRRLLESSLARWLQKSPRREGGGRRQSPDAMPPAALARPAPAPAPSSVTPLRAAPTLAEEIADSLAIAETTAPSFGTPRPMPMPMPAPMPARAPAPAPATASTAPVSAPGAVAPSAPAPVLDPEVIEELRSIMGDECQGLIRLFLEDAPQHIGKLQTALAGNDIAGMVAPAHTLKSSSANLGCMALSSVAKRIEHGARTNSLEKPALAVMMLENEFKRARMALSKLLS